MKKNRYNFPRRATNSNNPVYNQYVEDVYFSDHMPNEITESCGRKNVAWKNNGRTDVYHDELDDITIHQDPETVAQHYYERTTMPHG